jgi:hypothetical protein
MHFRWQLVTTDSIPWAWLAYAPAARGEHVATGSSPRVREHTGKRINLEANIGSSPRKPEQSFFSINFHL